MVELSVVIPTYNRAESLRRCLETLDLQTLPPDEFEVVVVDDGSEDGTLEMLQGLSPGHELRVFAQTNRGGAAARNEGVRRAHGRYCVFLDDDVLLAPSAVAEHLRAQRENGGVVAIGRLVFVPRSSRAAFPQYVADRWRRHAEALEKGRAPSFGDCWGGNISIPRAVLQAVGGFADDLRRNHDVELGFRLQQHGVRFVYVPTAAAEHAHDGAPEILAREFQTNAEWDLELARRHPAIREHLWLGRFGQLSWRAQTALKLLLLAHVPLRVVLAAASTARSQNRPRRFDFVVRYAYWRGIRRSVDRETWRQLTTSPRRAT